MALNIPNTESKRIVVIGAGFAGLKFVRALRKSDYQLVLIDRNNFHQFQPLFYQVATAGLEPSAISFPLRKIFQQQSNLHIRLTEVLNVNVEEKLVHTALGDVTYDYLVIATGATTNFFGIKPIADAALPMKTVGEALRLRNTILKNYEAALTCDDPAEIETLLNIVIVGGGPTGVELAGALAEMRSYVLPKDYPELNFRQMKIYLVEASSSLLGSMSASSSRKATHFLKHLGVNILTGIQVTGFSNDQVHLHTGENLKAHTVIWAAGIKGDLPEGLPQEIKGRSNRLITDEYNKVKGSDSVYAIGDIAFVEQASIPNGHPQVAQVAIQQAANLAANFKRISNDQKMKPFKYFDKGSMATIGRNKAVVDLPFWSFQGFFAWLVWMFVHLMSIVGVKNRMLIFINWLWNYMTYDQSLRLIMKPGKGSA
ncbi:MAG: NAD(P)/FAD-dependent oxidoreductase [Lentimicrobium sp.]|nr:NAD(P)/FAD-dependent oxidoreductase [Lentimicrobium sp.]